MPVAKKKEEKPAWLKELIDKKIEVGDQVCVTHEQPGIDGPITTMGKLMGIDLKDEEIMVLDLRRYPRNPSGVCFGREHFRITKITKDGPLRINKFLLKKELAGLKGQHIVPGVVVRAYWTYEDSEGDVRTAEHVGPLKALDRQTGEFEINPSLNSPGHYRGRLGAGNTKIQKLPNKEAAQVSLDILHKMKPVTVRGTVNPGTPRIKKPEKPVNPFKAKAKKPNPFKAKAEK